MATSSTPTKEEGKTVILFLVDGTGSMGNYLTALTSQVLPQCIKMVELLSTTNIQLDAIIYRDYCDSNIIESSFDRTPKELTDFLKKQRPSGGGDCPEAHKTGFNVMFEHYSPHDNILVLHYTDAPPHHKTTNSTNIQAEQRALKSKTPGFDWISISKRLLAQRIPVFTFMFSTNYSKFFTLCTGLGGEFILMPNASSGTIAKATIGVLVSVMGEIFQQGDTFSLIRHNHPNLLEVTQDENEYQLLKGTPKSESVSFSNIPVIEWLVSDIQQLPTRVLEDPEFRTLCIQILNDIFCPELILAITYNEVLGKVWRMLCRFRDDERIDGLKNAMSTCVTKLSGNDKEELQTWLEESYNFVEEIHEQIMEVPEEKRAPYLLLDGTSIPITRKDLLSVATCPSPGVLASVQKILCSVISVESGPMPVDMDGYVVGIPLSMNDKDIFSLLCHLIFPGVKFTMRPALIVAVVAFLGGNAILKDRAERFLSSRKGKWLGLPEGCLECPLSEASLTTFEQASESLSIEYCKLAQRVPQFLTDMENEFYKKMHRLWRLRSLAKKKISIKTAFTPRGELLPDFKKQCTFCGIFRSPSIMKDNVCGLCIRYQLDVVEHENQFKMEEKHPEQSHFFECRSCFVLYAVVNVDVLGCEPKCHYCRNGEPTPSVTCSCCKNRYLNAYSSTPGDWVCAVCTKKPSLSFRDQDIHLVNILAENELLRQYLGLSDALFPLIMGMDLTKFHTMRIQAAATIEHPLQLQSFYKLYTRFSQHLSVSCDPTIRKNDTTIFTVGGKTICVKNSILLDQIDVLLECGSTFEECVLCFENVGVNQLSSACGRCNNDICSTCARLWWSNAQPGKGVLPTHLCCPFCRQMPTAKVLKMYNKTLCALTGRSKLDIGGSSWYAWCLGCYQIKEAMKRDCASQQPQISSFRCSDCGIIEPKPELLADGITLRHCPVCDIPTEKDGGCNHITCVCEASWCYECGEAFDEMDIYEHMYDEHGSIG